MGRSLPDVTIAEVNRFAPYFLPVPHTIHTKSMNKVWRCFCRHYPIHLSHKVTRNGMVVSLAQAPTEVRLEWRLMCRQLARVTASNGARSRCASDVQAAGSPARVLALEEAPRLSVPQQDERSWRRAADFRQDGVERLPCAATRAAFRRSSARIPSGIASPHPCWRPEPICAPSLADGP